MTGQFLRDFTEKITISVRLLRNQKVRVKQGAKRYTYNDFQMFFNDLRAYYINRISTAPDVDKKAICYDSIQSFYLYQEDFGIYCDRGKLTTECEYHTKYFQSQYDLFDKQIGVTVVSKDAKYPNIFRNNNCLEKFRTILSVLNAFDKEGKVKKYAFQAKANAIWEVDKSKEMFNSDKRIMLPNITVQEFVAFLNSEFGLEIEYHSKFKLSSGEKHHRLVEQNY